MHLPVPQFPMSFISMNLLGPYHKTEQGNLSDRGSELISKQFTWLVNELGLIKVYTLPYTPTSNSVIEWTCAFLKASLRKCIGNHHIDGMKYPI